MSLASQSWNWSDVDTKVTPRLSAYLMTRGYVGKYEAEDLVQETYLRIYRRLDAGLQLATIEDFRRYAMTTADTVRIDHCRRKERRREVPFGKTEDGKTLEPPERVPTQEEVLDLKRIAALWDCINKLNQKRNYAKFLRADLAGKKYEEIAEEFKVSPGTVGSHLNTARKKLKKCLDLKADLAG